MEIFNKMIKNVTTKTYHYESVEELKKHLMSYLLYYSHQKELKDLKFKAPYDIIQKSLTQILSFFKDNPRTRSLGD
ncbi:hypothetical protein [Desulfurella amilsii]|uniref:hypothetical protein n=1 Tax=Desulfurella amilsii TaxID=1562698 RepID=UPI000A321886|nr:hypothetical protein [Desulfurella amilsii]